MSPVFTDSNRKWDWIRNGSPFDFKDRTLLSVGKSKQDLIKNVHPAVAVRQRMPYKWKEEYFIYFEDNAGVIVNSKFVSTKSTLI